MTTLRKFQTFGSMLAFGVASLITSGVVKPSLLGGIYKSRQSRQDGTFTRIAKNQVITAGPLEFWTSELDIKYPVKMREDETPVVEMNYSERWVKLRQKSDKNIVSDEPDFTEINRLGSDVRVSLSSKGAFDIGPKEEVSLSAQSYLPITSKWTITPHGPGQRVLLLRVESAGPGTEEFFDRGPKVEARINGQPSSEGSGGFELPVEVTTYWGVSHRVASVAAGAIALGGFFLGWPVVTGAIGSRRSVRCRVHTGFSGEHECAFINVVNRSQNKDIEITHVWFATRPRVNVLNENRALPKRLVPDESWETWIELSKLPKSQRKTCFDKARVLLTTGKVIKSVKREDVPSAGFIPG